MKKIAIIPARSCTTGLKHKNIKPLLDKPLMAYSIEAALSSEIFDKVIVYTDSLEYAEIAKQYGAEIFLINEETISNKDGTSLEVVKDILNNLKEKGEAFKEAVLLQPSSPLRDKNDIINGYNFYLEKEANFVVGVSEVEHSPMWANTLPEDLSMKNFINKEVSNLSNRKAETYYRINGALYIADVEYLMCTTNIYSHRSYAFKMDKMKSIDVEDDFDFYIAECLMKKNKI